VPITWIEIIQPKIVAVKYELDHPVVIVQDPDRRGFNLLLNATGRACPSAKMGRRAAL